MGDGQTTGFVVWHRSVFGSVLWSLGPLDFFVAFALVGWANWQPSKWFDGGRVVTLERGELALSQLKLAQRLGLTRGQIRGSLRRLERAEFLTKRASRTSGYSVISITNYDAYQDVASGPNPSLTRAEPEANPSLTTGKQENKETKKPKSNVAAAAATTQPDLFGTSERSEPPATGTSPRSITQRVMSYVNKKRNGSRPSTLGFEPYVKLVSRALAAGHTEKELKLVVWWAAEHEWPLANPDHARRVHPSTLFPLSKPSGYRALPQYLDLAKERYREVKRREFDPHTNLEVKPNGTS